MACIALMAIIPFNDDVSGLVLSDGTAIGRLAIEGNASPYLQFFGLFRRHVFSAYLS